MIAEELARTVIDACRTTGTGLLLTEQNLRFARQCTDRLYVLDSGQIVWSGDWPAFRAQPDIKHRYLAL